MPFKGGAGPWAWARPGRRRPAGPEGLGLLGVREPHAAARAVAQRGPDRLPAEARAQHGAVDAVGPEPLELALEERPAAERGQRLGQLAELGAQARAETARQHERLQPPA